MDTLIEALRDILGNPMFYVDGAWKYDLMLEYLVGACILLVVISSVFKFLLQLVK